MNSKRHTITINENSFKKLRGVGNFGESYSELILRLAESVKSGDHVEK
jgi:predicted CopG family antitoxin